MLTHLGFNIIMTKKKRLLVIELRASSQEKKNISQQHCHFPIRKHPISSLQNSHRKNILGEHRKSKLLKYI